MELVERTPWSNDLESEEISGDRKDSHAQEITRETALFLIRIEQSSLSLPVRQVSVAHEAVLSAIDRPLGYLQFARS
jgi:hypothetical protein